MWKIPSVYKIRSYLCIFLTYAYTLLICIVYQKCIVISYYWSVQFHTSVQNGQPEIANTKWPNLNIYLLLLVLNFNSAVTLFQNKPGLVRQLGRLSPQGSLHVSLSLVIVLQSEGVELPQYVLGTFILPTDTYHNKILYLELCGYISWASKTLPLF